MGYVKAAPKQHSTLADLLTFQINHDKVRYANQQLCETRLLIRIQRIADHKDHCSNLFCCYGNTAEMSKDMMSARILEFYKNYCSRSVSTKPMFVTESGAGEWPNTPSSLIEPVLYNSINTRKTE
jgi:hypothetical protein